MNDPATTSAVDLGGTQMRAASDYRVVDELTGTSESMALPIGHERHPRVSTGTVRGLGRTREVPALQLWNGPSHLPDAP